MPTQYYQPPNLLKLHQFITEHAEKIQPSFSMDNAFEMAGIKARLPNITEVSSYLQAVLTQPAGKSPGTYACLAGWATIPLITELSKKASITQRMDYDGGFMGTVASVFLADNLLSEYGPAYYNPAYNFLFSSCWPGNLDHTIARVEYAMTHNAPPDGVIFRHTIADIKHMAPRT